MALGTIYRTRLSLRVAVGAAAVLWAAALAVLARFPEVSPRTLISACAFLVFFVAFSAYYGRAAIAVLPEGIVVSSVLRQWPVRYDEILAIEVRSGLTGTIYEVLTRRGRIQFSSLFAHHRELCAILLERADLRLRD